MRIFLALFSITILFTLLFVTDLYADGHEAAAEKEVDVEAVEIKEAETATDKAKDVVETEASEVKEKMESEMGKKVDSMKEGEIEKAMESSDGKIEATSEEMDSTVVEEKMDAMTEEVEPAKEAVEEVKETPSEMKEVETMEEKVEAEPSQDMKESGEEVPPAMVDTEMDTTEDAEMLVEEPPVPVVEKEVVGSVVSMGPNTITVKNDRDNQDYLLSHSGLESIQNVAPGYRVEAVFDEANNNLLRLKVLGVPVKAKPLIIKTK